MMTRNLFARCAPTAIAASAALYTVSATAQDAAAEPVIVLPDPAPATAPVASAPAIVLPQTTVAPEPVAVPEPVAAAPVAAQPAARTVAPRAAVRAPAVRSATAAPAAAPAAPVAAAPAAAPVTSAVEAAPVAAEPAIQAPVAANTADNTGELALAGLLGALGLAAVSGVAFAASRRRRRNAEVGYEPMAYEPVADEPVAEPQPVAAVSAPAPVFTTSAPVASAFSAPVVRTPAASRAAPARANGDPIALPQEAPETFEERDALLKELVAAEPDKANPFTSPRARARRAKLIIQSLGRNFNSRKPRFDLSEYTNRWPALRGWQPATA